MSTEPEALEEDEAIGLDLLDHIRLLESVVMAATKRLSSELLAEELGRVGALHVQQEVKALTGHVRDLQIAADHLLLDTMDGERRAEIDGHVVEVRRSYKRTWDTPLLAGAVAACVLEGERIPEVDKVVEAFVTTARMEWRVTELEKLPGLDPDRYCEKELGRPTVQVT